MIPQKVSHFSARSPINTKIDKKRPSGIPFSTLPKSNHLNISRIASGTTYEKIVKMAKISTVERMIQMEVSSKSSRRRISGGTDSTLKSHIGLAAKANELKRKSSIVSSKRVSDLGAASINRQNSSVRRKTAMETSN